jgi:uncharacterized protein
LERKYENWYENGQLRFQGFYRNGKLEGERKSWYENGQLQSQEFYRDGKEEGERKYWHEDGQIWIHDFYRDGEREGKRKLWNENGHIRELTFFRTGNYDGECKWLYIVNNIILIHKYYVNGEDIGKFSIKKKLSLLSSKKWLRVQSFVSVLDSQLICDLAKMIF